MEPWEPIHRAAVEQGRSWYRDPTTGYRVFTELFLSERGQCCGSGCRHCPYDPVAVQDRGREPG